MNLEYVPLFEVQRKLQGMPRDFDRFRQYLRTIKSPHAQSLELPSLIAMNPMGKEHVTELLDALLHPSGQCAKRYSPQRTERHSCSGTVRRARFAKG